jgi:membrane protease subunit (stomatin/prohibitin family)
LRADLEREKALTLRSIKELEFDKAMGKLSQQDFDQMAARLRARAVGIMKQLDAGASIYRAQVEQELAARIGKTHDVKARPASANACACGTANDADAKFCKTCGTKLTGAVA